jgi:DNA-binding transcriptional ArsR family regulator
MEVTAVQGDADIARAAAMFADPARARILTALSDGRSLAASVLANEAGLSAPGVSAHLGKLREAGLVQVETSGRHRFYSLARPDIVDILESLARIAPAQPVTSLKACTRAQALRFARTCYDHLAGRLGVAVTAALLERGALVSTDGVPGNERRTHDRISSQLPTHPYTLGPHAVSVFAKLGVDLDAARARSRRPLLRFCLDWSEQRHHLAGALGAELADSLQNAGWVRRRQPGQRALTVTPEGAAKLHEHLDVDLG